MKYQINSKGLLLFLIISVLSCHSESTSESPELSLSEKLIGEWILTNYYSDSFSPQEQTGRIEEIVPEETDYGIEFTDNPKKIILTGFLRYSVQSYEIEDNEKVVKSEHTNFMDAEHGEGFHVNDWRIENEILITEDPTGDGGDPFISKSEVQLSGNTLKLTLENSQFNPNRSGQIILEYKRK